MKGGSVARIIIGAILIVWGMASIAFSGQQASDPNPNAVSNSIWGGIWFAAIGAGLIYFGYKKLRREEKRKASTAEDPTSAPPTSTAPPQAPPSEASPKSANPFTSALGARQRLVEGVIIGVVVGLILKVLDAV